MEIQLKKDCWNIIYAEQNRDKEYTRIQAGTDIYLDPDTKEPLWGDMMKNHAEESKVALAVQRAKQANGTVAVQGAAPEKPSVDGVPHGPEIPPVTLNENLVSAIEPMIGQTYSNINCYELLVSGLNKLGVQYSGRGGLGRQLIAEAVDRGLPMNAYLNGEGLITVSGSKVYGKSFFRIDDPTGQARQVIEEMASHLEKGSILSFSTETRGHTGIVSNKNGTWTYINSGVMDNPVDSILAPKGVGEEKLDKEIENWFKLAARRKESLVITLGKLNQNKLAAFGTRRELSVS